jgi:SAM-dependent methyltransferase
MKSYGLISKISDYRRTDSVAYRMRQKRYEHFLKLATSVGRPLTILDVGGTKAVWERIGFVDRLDIRITLLNISIEATGHSNVESVIGDARNMRQYPNRYFDVVFSNSVIEHVGGMQEIQSMANEILRVAKNYYIQTPNRYFPIEPHFVFPMFQFLPIHLRTVLIQRFALGWFHKIPDRQKAEEVARGINLLSRKEMKHLFPDAVITNERMFGLTKSIQAHRFGI